VRKEGSEGGRAEGRREEGGKQVALTTSVSVALSTLSFAKALRNRRHHYYPHFISRTTHLEAPPHFSKQQVHEWRESVYGQCGHGLV
jgi:hypothetical protein